MAETYFVSVTDSEHVKLYLCQKPLPEVERALRAWPYHHGRAQVFEMRVVPPAPGQTENPSNHLSLACVSQIYYHNMVERHRALMLCEMDNQPPEQALREIEQTLVDLENHKSTYQNRLALLTTGQ